MDHRNSHVYWRLAAMGALSFVAMFGLMYAMVDARANVLVNVNQAYMAGLMTAPMLMLELALMRAMYRDRMLNALVVSGSLVLLAACWLLVRHQGAVGDRQFLRSMIPHHGGAILMCEEAELVDPRIQALCERIRASQEAEIREMKTILRQLDP